MNGLTRAASVSISLLTLALANGACSGSKTCETPGIASPSLSMTVDVPLQPSTVSAFAGWQGRLDVEGLPPGITVDQDGGFLEGTPTAAGTFKVTAYDYFQTGDCVSSSVSFTVVVADRPAECKYDVDCKIKDGASCTTSADCASQTSGGTCATFGLGGGRCFCTAPSSCSDIGGGNVADLLSTEGQVYSCCPTDLSTDTCNSRGHCVPPEE